MRIALDRELTLEADSEFVLPSLAGVPLDSRVFTLSYHDNADATLARSGIALRRRLENGVSVWQLKLPPGDQGLELELHGGPGGPPAEIQRVLAAHLRAGPLMEVARLRTRRSGVRVSEPSPIEVTLDDVAVLDGGRERMSFREIDVELRDGSRADLKAVAKVLRGAGARRRTALPKLFRAIGMPAPETHRDHVHARLRQQHTAILANDPGTRLGTDPEAVHEMRVATRRLRALLRAIRPFAERGMFRELYAELGWLGRLLGDVRDLDVLIVRLEHEVAALDESERAAGADLLRRLGDERSDRHQLLVTELDGARYFALLDRLEEAARSLPHLHAKSLPGLAAHEFKRVRKASQLAGADPPDAVLHELRKMVKHARYAAELVEGKPTARFVEASKQFQEVVGEHQDAIVAEETLRGLVVPRLEPAQALVIGRLLEKERVRRQDAYARWRRSWRRLERRGKKMSRSSR